MQCLCTSAVVNIVGLLVQCALPCYVLYWIFCVLFVLTVLGLLQGSRKGPSSRAASHCKGKVF